MVSTVSSRLLFPWPTTVRDSRDLGRCNERPSKLGSFFRPQGSFNPIVGKGAAELVSPLPPQNKTHGGRFGTSSCRCDGNLEGMRADPNSGDPVPLGECFAPLEY
jgi:hypothetical protein